MSNSETQPLLSDAEESLSNLLPETRARKNRSFFRRYRLDVWLPIIALTSIVIAIVVSFFVNVEPDLGEYIAEGSTFDTDDVQFLGITDDGGVRLLIQGQNYNNFSNIHDHLARKYISTSGYFLRRLNLKVDELNLLVADDSKGTAIDLGTVSFSPFTVNVYDHATTNLELILDIHPNMHNAWDIIKKILSEPDSQFRLKGDAAVKILIFNGYIPVTNLIIPLDLILPTGLVSKLTPDNFKLENFQLSEEEESLNCVFDVIMDKNPIQNLLDVVDMDKFSVPELNFRLIVDDCEKRPTLTLASLRSSKFELHPIADSEDLQFSASLKFDQKQKAKLSQKCIPDDNKDKSTPLSKFVDSITNQNFIDFVIAGDRIEAYDSPLLNKVFQKVEFPVSIPFNASELSGRYLQNVTMDDVSFQLKNGTIPMISGNLQILLNLGSLELKDFSVNSIRGSADLNYLEQKFGDLNVTEWRTATTTPITQDNINYVLIQAQLDDVFLHITNLDLFEQVVGKVLRDGNAEVDIDALVDVFVHLLFGDFEVDAIAGSGHAEFGF
ncbi:unnamed protein product [Ambrosiozyma monospora]|uniref:Unnamed protein product n=1 Tax=Ambrosiozyma monospora TaxID=43982 RepID=A0A9W6YQH5_AMBMO|nr:unnamed protein product [Ambrosiozyma monospora]